MYSTDLIQRIFHQKEKGDSAPYDKVYGDLLAQCFEHSSSFDLSDRTIYWGLFSDGRYQDIISQYNETFYFYLWNDPRDLEVIIPARIYTDSGVYSNVRDLPVSERKVKLYPEMWIVGPSFPGLEGITRRPLKLFQASSLANREDRMSRLNQLFVTLFQYYFEEKPLLYEKEDYPQSNKRLLNG